MNRMQKYISELLDIRNMGMTKKVCILLFLVMGLAFFYQNHVLSQPLGLSPVDAVAVPPKTYISFREGNGQQIFSKYLTVDSTGNVQVNTLHTTNIPAIANAAHIAKDSRGVAHFAVHYGDFFFNWGTQRIFYQKEGSTVQETIPFPYGAGMSQVYTGFLPYTPKLVIDSRDTPYVIAAGRTYVQGAAQQTSIYISKRTSTGWTPATLLFQTSTYTPMPEVSLSFDSNSNGHVFYVLFTNPNCISITCPRSVYELVFDRSFNVVSNNQVMTFSGGFPEVFSLKSVMLQGSRESFLGYISNPSTAQTPSLMNMGFGTSKNTWVQQILASSYYNAGTTFSTSIDMEADLTDINYVATEKNVNTNTAKIQYMKSRNQGRSWTTNTLLSSTTSQYRDIYAQTSTFGGSKELQIAYVEGAFGDLTPFTKINLMKVSPTGTTTNSVVYQNPMSLMLGDMAV